MAVGAVAGSLLLLPLAAVLSFPSVPFLFPSPHTFYFFISGLLSPLLSTLSFMLRFASPVARPSSFTEEQDRPTPVLFHVRGGAPWWELGRLRTLQLLGTDCFPAAQRQGRFLK